MDLNSIVRPNILNLKPYSCARDEYGGGNATVFLDANESPYNSPLNRYPDPLQRELKREIAKVKGVSEDCIFVGNGSDEAIDIIFRIFCIPGTDNVTAIEPTYGMYRVCADINNVEYRAVPLNDDYSLNSERLLAATDRNTKAIFLCTPNNPTGNSLDRGEILKIINRLNGIVVVDEAYGDFSSLPSFREDIKGKNNLIVLNTMSKAWAAAGIRLGMAFADNAIIHLMNKVKYPYNVSRLSQKEALAILKEKERTSNWIKTTLAERERVTRQFSQLPICIRLFPTDANFFLARVTSAQRVYNYLVQRGIVVRNRDKIALCNDCLRITIGNEEENNALIDALKSYEE